MNKRKIDLSDIKENDLDKTSTFKDLMSRSERKKREEEKLNEVDNNTDDIVDMLEEKKKSTKDLTKDLERIKEKDEELSSTQILELTRQMKFNVNENIKEERKKGYNYITYTGIFNLIALAYFIYALLYTNYLDNEIFLVINGGIILLMFLKFDISILTSKKTNKVLSIFNFLILIGYIAFNLLNILGYLN